MTAPVAVTTENPPTIPGDQLISGGSIAPAVDPANPFSTATTDLATEKEKRR